MKRRFCAALLWLPLWLWASEQDAHTEHESAVQLTPAQQRRLDIQIQPLEPRALLSLVQIPAEIKADRYRQSLVAPRIASQVVARHVGLGDWLRAGTPLVTLFSEAMAERQSALRLAWREWQRAQALSDEVLSAQRRDEIRARYEQALAAAQAVGLEAADIDEVQSDQPLRFGEYRLRAGQPGRVLDDDFSLGESIQAGQPLLRLLDERVLWVEAALPVSQAQALAGGGQAWVLAGEERAPASVQTLSHRIDPRTRTHRLRLSLDNADDRFHDGQYVEVQFAQGTGELGLVLPDEALVQGPDGDWQVFVAEGEGRFEPREVELGERLAGGYRIQGLDAGTPVVVKGAFFLASELAKAGFDAHGH
ncbi:efflux RND transporter periplasmic adaptor subunit [Gallaecimonas sp. GXIMD4217]|uniref:efflux RND transporter periplasmic adaptor subunit n=1 Tax=Gallaecimonas sp. GXIMD4217 TaxID=3131927 RepID=UPI00311B421A